MEVFLGFFNGLGCYVCLIMLMVYRLPLNGFYKKKKKPILFFGFIHFAFKNIKFIYKKKYLEDVHSCSSHPMSIVQPTVQ